jgi:hypothetical protein
MSPGNSDDPRRPAVKLQMVRMRHGHSVLVGISLCAVLFVGPGQGAPARTACGVTLPNGRHPPGTAAGKLARKREAVYPALATRGDPCRPALRQSGWLDLDEVPLVGGPRSAQTSQNWRPATRRPGPPTSRAGQLGRGSGLSRIVLGIRSHVSASRLLAGHRPRRQGAADVRDACPQGVWLAQLGSRTSLAWASVRECSPGPAAHRAADSPGQRETGGPIAQTAIRAP